MWNPTSKAGKMVLLTRVPTEGSETHSYGFSNLPSLPDASEVPQWNMREPVSSKSFCSLEANLSAGENSVSFFLQAAVLPLFLYFGKLKIIIKFKNFGEIKNESYSYGDKCCQNTVSFTVILWRAPGLQQLNCHFQFMEDD